MLKITAKETIKIDLCTARDMELHWMLTRWPTDQPQVPYWILQRTALQDRLHAARQTPYQTTYASCTFIAGLYSVCWWWWWSLPLGRQILYSESASVWSPVWCYEQWRPQCWQLWVNDDDDVETNMSSSLPT